MPDTDGADVAVGKSAERALAEIDRYMNTLFDRAPVMMHSIDRSGRLVRVNRRWLHGLGYKKREVLGKRSIDFLTDSFANWIKNRP